MYTQYFGLTEKPFSIAPDPHFLYLSELHREALAHLLYGIESGGCLVLLTGGVGTGKTTVSRCLVEQLPEATEIALILNPKLTANELLTTICEELQIEGAGAQHSVKGLIDLLNRHLLETHAQGKNTVLIVDEAQDLDPDILEQLRLLTNLETNKEKLLKIILLGQPELRDILNQPQFSQINQRITSRYHLLPLQEQDVGAYINHRIKVAGGGRARLFSDKAIKRISELSKGIPRLINLLCDRALLGAYAEDKDQVDRKIAAKAGREVFGSSGRAAILHGSHGVRTGRTQPAVFLSLVLALLITGAMLFFFSPHVDSMLPKKQIISHAEQISPAHESSPVVLKQAAKTTTQTTLKSSKKQRETHGAHHSVKEKRE